MVSFKNILVLASAASAFIIPREVQSTLKDLAYINSNTTALTTAANNYNGGGVAKAIPVANAESALESSVKAATTDANNHGTYTSAEATQVINYINGTLEPNIVKAVTAIINKKSQFTTDGLKTTVYNDFVNLKNETDTLGAALLKKAPSSSQSSGKAVLAKIDADLQKGINAYSS